MRRISLLHSTLSNWVIYHPKTGPLVLLLAIFPSDTSVVALWTAMVVADVVLGLLALEVRNPW